MYNQLAVLIANIIKQNEMFYNAAPTGRKLLELAPARAATCIKESQVYVSGFAGDSSYMNGIYSATNVTCKSASVFSNGNGGYISQHDGIQNLQFWFIGNASLLDCTSAYAYDYAVFSDNAYLSPGQAVHWYTALNDIYTMANITFVSDSSVNMDAYCLNQSPPPSPPPRPPLPPPPP